MPFSGCWSCMMMGMMIREAEALGRWASMWKQFSDGLPLCIASVLQGVVVSSSAATRGCHNDDERMFLLDDSTGIVTVEMNSTIKANIPCASQYVMIIGVVVDDDAGTGKRHVLAHQLIDLSSQPEREGMWNLEVMQYWLGYLSGRFTN